VSMENHGGMTSTGNVLIRPPELSGNPTSSHLVAKQEELAKEMNLALRSIFARSSKGSLTCRKILRYETDGFTSPPKEDLLRIFSPLKILRPRPDMNLRTWGSVASMLTIMPLKTTSS
jgi:hypothetical protein